MPLQLNSQCQSDPIISVRRLRNVVVPCYPPFSKLTSKSTALVPAPGSLAEAGLRAVYPDRSSVDLLLRKFSLEMCSRNTQKQFWEQLHELHVAQVEIEFRAMVSRISTSTLQMTEWVITWTEVYDKPKKKTLRISLMQSSKLPAKYCEPLHLYIPQIISGSAHDHQKLQHQPNHTYQKKDSGVNS